MNKLSILLLCSAILEGIFSAEWAYTGAHGHAHWERSFPACGEDQQSPINIFKGDVRFDSHLPAIKYSNYDTNVGLALTLRNNGHSAAVALSGPTTVTISAGGLPAGMFRAFQFHFHWGENDLRGSEHLVNGSAFPMELHIVHYNTKYANPGLAARNADGLAVLAFFYEVSEDDNLYYSSIVENLPAVLYPELKIDIMSVPLNTLLPPSFSRFYRYFGSLTTPPCQESVTWTVFKDTIKISESQLDAFRSLLGSHARPMSNNFRPVQELNHRHVTANFDPDVHWTYKAGTINAEQWLNYYSTCAGNNQSPITIPTRGSRFDSNLQHLNFHNYDRISATPFKLKNNGHTANLDISAADSSISGGGLPETYIAARLHFHWGSSDKRGSEHTLGNKTFPMEMHIVHYKKSLGRLTKAVFQPEGLAVLGFLFEIAPRDNPALNTLIKSLRAIRAPGSQVTTAPFSLDSLLPSDRVKFYRYSGSLTIPGCFESVIWTVFQDTIKISPSQLTAFRLLKSWDTDTDGHIVSLVNNYRPVQKLNNRVVTRNFIGVPGNENDEVKKPEILDKLHRIIASRMRQEQEFSEEE